MKKRLLIMASLFYPQKNSGGPPISIKNLVDSIYNDFDIYIISKNHEINEKEALPNIKNGWNDFYFGKTYYFEYGSKSFTKLTKLIQEIKPDVIYQNSFFSYDDVIPVLKYAKKYKIKVIIAPRGEFYPKRLAVGQTKKKIYTSLLRYLGLLKNIYFQGTGKEESQYIEDFVGISRDKIYNINNLSIIICDDTLIAKHSGSLKLVYVARVHPTKNLLNAIKYLKNMAGQIQYDIYGSIEDNEYWKLCQMEINKLQKNVKVNYMGNISHDKVAQTISKYHVFFMPTIGENYGHSIVESLLISRPVIISDTTPWNDINENNCGFAIELENENKFKNKINKFINMDNSTYQVYCNNARKYINSKLNTDSIIKAYIDMFNN